MSTTTNTGAASLSDEKRVALHLTTEQVSALYLHLVHRARPDFGWIEVPLVGIEEALKPAHNAIHDRGFNAMNRQFFGDNRFAFEEGAMPNEIAPVSTSTTPQADAAPLPRVAATVSPADVQWEAHLLEVVEHTIDTLDRQLELIAERAPGKFLDKTPVVRSLTVHKQRLERAVAERNASFAAPAAASNGEQK